MKEIVEIPRNKINSLLGFNKSVEKLLKKEHWNKWISGYSKIIDESYDRDIIQITYEPKPEQLIYREQFDYLISQVG